jgi:hypothetical protein
MIRIFDEAGTVIEAHEQPRQFKEPGNANCNLDKPVAISYPN